MVLEVDSLAKLLSVSLGLIHDSFSYTRKEVARQYALVLSSMSLIARLYMKIIVVDVKDFDNNCVLQRKEQDRLYTGLLNTTKKVLNMKPG